MDVETLTHEIALAGLFMILFLTANVIAQSVRERFAEFATLQDDWFWRPCRDRDGGAGSGLALPGRGRVWAWALAAFLAPNIPQASCRRASAFPCPPCRPRSMLWAGQRRLGRGLCQRRAAGPAPDAHGHRHRLVGSAHEHAAPDTASSPRSISAACSMRLWQSLVIVVGHGLCDRRAVSMLS